MSEQRVGDMRVNYSNPPMSSADMAPAPLTQFRSWFDVAVNAGLVEPNAMVVSTADKHGRVSSRTVLLKTIDGRGLCFFTNLQSSKARAIANNPQVSAVFPWYPLQRQVCVTGVAELLPRDEVDAYFASRPRESQLGAWASPQSEVIESGDDLQVAFDAAVQRFPDAVPAPPHWGGFLIAVETMEFWSGQPSRLHDRLRYRRTAPGGLDDASAWTLERLAP